MPPSEEPQQPKVFERLQPHLSVKELKLRDVLAETEQRVDRVYFPHSGIISSLVMLADGSAIETGMIGNDGVFGASQALDDKVSLNHVVVQVAGTASVIPCDQLCKAAEEHPSLRVMLVKYELFFVAQVQQTAACNAVHDIRCRTCKWLLQMHDLAGTELPLTQDFLARMMGVRRTSVTVTARELQDAGMITYRRGRIRIIDPELIKKSACECYEDVRSRYQRTFKFNGGGASAEV